MKLLKKINRQYIIASGGVMLVGIISLYVILISISSHEIEESLYASRLRIVKHLEQSKTYPDLYPLVEVKEVPAIKPTVISDTTIYDEAGGEEEVFKQLLTYETIHGKTYQIVVRTVALEKNDIYLTIFFSVITILALLLLILYGLNRKTAINIWGAFNQNLKSIQSFSLQDNNPVSLQESGIEEFDELKLVLEQMSQKIIDDYNNLKQFSENAAHELQTPLSIIRSKLEVLLNDKNLSREQSAALQIIYQTVIRLSKLNRSLLLLTKIENLQYDLKEELMPAVVIRETLEEFGEIISMKKIRLNTNLQDEVKINMDASLARVLIENLLNNAIKYTEKGGEISIDLNKQALTISNTASERLKNGAHIFERFVKENQSAASVGLGLSIAHKICALNNFDISYDHAGGKHIFRIDFY